MGRRRLRGFVRLRTNLGFTATCLIDRLLLTVYTRTLVASTIDIDALMRHGHLSGGASVLSPHFSLLWTANNERYH
ncbi:hypothetical protein B0T17DRAFT_13507 [Bombardia bombarda]|uniref:Uncharacterized protein n=1 Tax=Bombardia bombarda TaxID=252184 RepID=A0AA39XJC2_9PEZI|nr:hypothetical protein B0T17DRAFT_13507 [Bombardia bombarda]